MKEIDRYIDQIYKNVNKKSKDIQDLKNEMKVHLISVVEELKNKGYSEEESLKIAIERFGEVNEIEDELDDVANASNQKFRYIKSIAVLIIILIYAVIIIRIKFMNPFVRSSLLMTKELVKKSPELLGNILNLIPLKGLNSEAALKSVAANAIMFIPLGFL